MVNQSSAIVQRLWNYCTVLRDDGLSYGDYVEQLTYLLFLKMDDERRKIDRSVEISRWLSVVAATEQTITANFALAEHLRQPRNGRAFTGQLVLSGQTHVSALFLRSDRTNGHIQKGAHTVRPYRRCIV